MIDPALLLNPLDEGQCAAAQPADHVWLNASAGTGKTQVLSARVLRLMLDGVPPEAILCITFTKAGAAEMAHRIHERLALWVRANDFDLRADLHALGADVGQPAILDQARSLFATVIDSAGGAVRVQTIHSFCQTLLASFPLEAKIMPGFTALEGGEAEALQRETLSALLAETGADGGRMRAAAAMLSLRLGQDGAQTFLSRCASAFAAPLQRLVSPRPHDLRAALDLPDGDPEEWKAAELKRGVLRDADAAAVAQCGRNWGVMTGEKRAEIIDLWRSAPLAEQVAGLKKLRNSLIRKKDGVLSPDFSVQGKKMGDAGDEAARLLSAIDGLLNTATAMQVADDLAAAWDLGSHFAESYALAKRTRGLADFDDMISIATTLLQATDFGDWVRFKLDQRTDHILVDEAQDTNTRQWTIIWSLTEEFFAGLGAKDDRRRTLFAVGDPKQSIMSFQGAEPKAFGAAKRLFEDLGHAVGNPFEQVDLRKNYRSSPAILNIVDAWVETSGAADMGLEGSVPSHIPHKYEHPGRVELWQPLPVAKALNATAAEEAEEDGDEGYEAGDQDRLAAASDPASLRLSHAIADEVQDWIANGKDGRSVAPGDIMILVRKRRDLAARIVARLQSLQVPVAGVDRFALTGPLGVQDLLSAMRFAVQPLDDLNLAALLVSPLIGWSQDDLLHIAHGRGRSALWERLRTREEEVTPESMTALRSLLGMADFTTPFRFLETILSGPMDGRRRLYQRLGKEARDPIDELLNQALAFERQETPSLLGFLSYISASTADIKRQNDARSDMVRVMTVHGSKGLQAPIVILADATDDPDKKRMSFDLPLEGWDSLPVFLLSKDERQGRIAKAHDDKTEADLQEHWRLLYVAMTRAEELLVVTGITKTEDRSLPDNCWHGAVDSVMAAMECEWEDAGPRWGKKRVHASHAKNWPSVGNKKQKKPTSAIAIPAWAKQAAPQESRPPRPLAPSSLGVDDVASPPQGHQRGAAAARGLLLHSLFERLPAVAEARRRPAAERWLAAQAPDLDAATRAAMVDEALAVLDNPAYAAFFGSNSLAEVPLSAVVEGMVVTGIVDRLLVSDTDVTVIDYKTGHHVPASAADVTPAYLRQMAAYQAALAVIFPGRTINAALLYTAGPRLIALGDADLAPHKPGLVASKANLSATP